MRTFVQMPKRNPTSTFQHQHSVLKMVSESKQQRVEKMGVLLLHLSRDSRFVAVDRKKRLRKVSYGYFACDRREFQFNVLPRYGEAVHGLLLNPFLPHTVYHNVIEAFEDRRSDLHR